MFWVLKNYLIDMFFLVPTSFSLETRKDFHYELLSEGLIHKFTIPFIRGMVDVMHSYRKVRPYP